MITPVGLSPRGPRISSPVERRGAAGSITGPVVKVLNPIDPWHDYLVCERQVLSPCRAAAQLIFVPVLKHRRRDYPS
jgi:hypothetical protein